MSTNDPSTAQIHAALSEPVPAAELVGPDLSRRRFLQASTAAGVATFLPAWLADHVGAATPIGPSEGVLVLLTMSGGNDGLNTFVPIADGAYRDARSFLAIRADQTLAMTAERGLNRRLPFLKSMWDQGRLAVVDGVGQVDPDLSHFVSTGRTMLASHVSGHGGTGWLGRYLDGLTADPLHGISFGSSVPLVVRGRRARATAVSRTQGNWFKRPTDEPTFERQNQALRVIGSRANGLGHLADQNMAGMAEAIDLPDVLSPRDDDDKDEPRIVTHMKMAARIINANIGTRIISIAFGDFDSHSQQQTMHDERMDELNAALQAFYTTLHPSFESRTLVVGTSEFGRRVRENGSRGTDHGTSNSLFLLGSGVKGGFHGQMPSLSSLDRRGNPQVTVDYRHLYANITERWLGADAAQIHGRDYGDLGLLASPGTGRTTPVAPPAPVVTAKTRRAEVARLYLAYFLRPPDESGHDYWVGVRRSGRSLREISNEFASSSEFRRRYGAMSNQQFIELIYQNVLARNPDGEGLAYWKGLLDRGAGRGEVMVGFSESSEFQNKTAGQIKRIEEVGPIGRLYRAYFLRPADDDGLAYWINTDLPTAAIADQFATSPEFVNRYGSVSNEQFVRMAYRNVLNREPDAAGLAHWTGVLHRGTSRGRVMLGFSDSGEFVAKVQQLVGQ